MAPALPKPSEIIEIFDDDAQIEDITSLPPLAGFFDDAIEIEDDEPANPSGTSEVPGPVRNAPVRLPRIELESHVHPAGGGEIARGSTWKLHQQHRHLAAYLFIRQIVKNVSTDEVVVRGIPMYPNKRIGGMLDWGGYAKYNTYMEVKVDRDDKRPWYIQGMCELPVMALARDTPTELATSHYDRNTDTQSVVHLTCRRVLLTLYNNALERVSKSTRKVDIEFVLHTLSARCVEELKHQKPPQRLTSQHRIIPNSRSHRVDSNHQRYPYVSLFSGCGGDCKGAKDAGASLQFAIDIHEPANQTNRPNFPNAAVYCDTVSNVSLYGQRQCRILHLSPPCQPHSMAHTRVGVNDEANYLASLACRGAIEVLSYPDILTVENVAGLMIKRDSIQWFVTIINQLSETGPGYNVRWKLLNFREYGLVPRRTRFVAFASRRGIPLPEFPKPSHGPRGLWPFATIYQALRSMTGRPFLSHNEVPGHCTVFSHPRAPYDPHTKVMGCITTSGGEDNVHPSGLRTFTICELATLHMIPFDFQFPEIARSGVAGGLSKSEIVKQIGNCIPPGVWTVFVRSIIDTLKAYDDGELDADGNITVPRPPPHRADSAQPEVIQLDSDDEGKEPASSRDRLSRTLRAMSVTVSRASSRTLSPEASPRPTKRSRYTARTSDRDIIDLTED